MFFSPICQEGVDFKDPSHKLLAQDILYQMFDKHPEKQTDKTFEEVLELFSEDQLEPFFDLLCDSIKELQIEQGSEKIVFSIRNDNLSFSIGQRYCINLYSKEEKGLYGFISKEQISANAEQYLGNGPQPWYNYINSFDLSESDKDSLYKALQDELNRTNKSSFSDRYNNTDFENYIFERCMKKDDKIDQLIKLLKHKKQIILQGPPGTGKTYLAKKIAKEMVGDNPDNVKLVQFHPSYSYEDFVRGITVESNGDGKIEYSTKDKTFVEMIKMAHQFLPPYDEVYLNEKLEEFWKEIENNFDELNEKYDLSFNLITINPDKLDFRLKTNHNNKDGWVNKANVFSYAKSKLLDIGFTYKKDWFWKESIGEDFVKYFRQNHSFKYVLIIDEINRANLPSVLGELIYALEYRGEEVESMYAKDGDTKITIPENLYIIGTMNTADRSVGHIDYAIRRRFAFENVIPDAEPINNPKAKELFHRVADLFVTEEQSTKRRSDYVAADFDYRDVQIGHSYFILKDEKDIDQKELKMRWQYEIYPILNEYIKDGILLETAKEEIDNIVNEFGFDS